MYQVIDDMAALTASAQLHCGGTQGSGSLDDLMAFVADQGGQAAVIGYAQHYALTVKKDYREFQKDFKRGKYEKT
ncbi:hypothetical protein D0C36_16175 [Mucilaginibacter conchicola]|uniref:Uncharacterized protein n=1 Tax=Mucilaginibacter conchicola TaxID=2303333 RepID=A0A372NV62_9SPHI|nr:hypothetical protein [Mucilaginibacter conchicola]RFZ92924.1 hypothetical protein D0C36_16175 [Mucilaginibacter conchicola]